MELTFATRATIVAGAVLLAFVLIVFGPSPAPVLHRPHPHRPHLHRRRSIARRLRSARLMYYVAAAMAILLGGIIALTG